MVTAELKVLETGEIRSQQIYMGDFPWMTSQGTFIINGAERVVVSQLVRSPGVFYTDTIDPVSGRALWSAKVIPNRGAWLEFETSGKDQLYVKVAESVSFPPHRCCAPLATRRTTRLLDSSRACRATQSILTSLTR